MRCEEFRKRYSAFAHWDLPKTQMEVMSKHLSSCRECSKLEGEDHLSSPPKRMEEDEKDYNAHGQKGT